MVRKVRAQQKETDRRIDKNKESTRERERETGIERETERKRKTGIDTNKSTEGETPS